MVLYSLDRGPRWPPSSNFRLLVGRAREPAPANSRSWFLFFYFAEEKPTFSRAPCHVRYSWTSALYLCNHFASMSVGVCYPYVHFSVMVYLNANITRCGSILTELMTPKLSLYLCKYNTVMGISGRTKALCGKCRLRERWDRHAWHMRIAAFALHSFPYWWAKYWSLLLDWKMKCNRGVGLATVMPVVFSVVFDIYSKCWRNVSESKHTREMCLDRSGVSNHSSGHHPPADGQRGLTST